MSWSSTISRTNSKSKDLPITPSTYAYPTRPNAQVSASADKKRNSSRMEMTVAKTSKGKKKILRYVALLLFGATRKTIGSLGEFETTTTSPTSTQLEPMAYVLLESRKRVLAQRLWKI